MLTYPKFDPVAFHLGPWPVHWYGLAYLAGFLVFWVLAQRRIRRADFAGGGWLPQDIEDLLFYAVLGVVLGGRLGYVLFYKPGWYASHPLEIFKVWEGGMAFHGGLLGVLVALAWFARKTQRRFLAIGDVVAPCVGLSFGLVRLANFVNGELWGRLADPALPWSMVFPQSGTLQPRHPSQLYQAFLEGVVMFGLLAWYARRPRPLGAVSGMFLLLYGVQRFAVEFFREPDNFLGLLSLGLSMGQWLSLPLIGAGAILLALAGCPALRAGRAAPPPQPRPGGGGRRHPGRASGRPARPCARPDARWSRVRS